MDLYYHCFTVLNLTKEAESSPSERQAGFVYDYNSHQAL